MWDQVKDYDSIFGGFLGLLGLIFGGWYKRRYDRAKAKAKAESSRSEWVDSRITGLDKQVSEIRLQQTRTDAELTELRREIADNRRARDAAFAALRREMELSSKMEEERFGAIYRLLKAMDSRMRGNNSTPPP